MAVTFNHSGIVVSDLDRSLKFYCEGLGLHASLIVEGEGAELSQWLGYPNVKVRAAFVSGIDGTSIEIIEYKNPKAATRSAEDMHKRAAIGASHLAFIVEDIDKTWKKLISMGGKKLNPPVNVGDKVKGLYMQDPDGIWVELDEDKTHQDFAFRIIQNTGFAPALPAPTKTTL
ncbi:MAG: VOC family protein [Chloroflexi bacterium]|nr:VOC family protein [Chloroflexota bacterium]